MDQAITVNSRRFDGSIKRTWKCKLAARTDERIDLVGKFEIEVDHPELGIIRKGTISHEYFWPGRWYNIFRFSEPDGEVRCHYINIAMPPVIYGLSIDVTDLDVDIVVGPDGRHRILDMDEMKVNAEAFGYGEILVKRILGTVDELIAVIAGGGLYRLIH